jgi:hypothetical protein
LEFYRRLLGFACEILAAAQIQLGRSGGDLARYGFLPQAEVARFKQGHRGFVLQM